MLPLIMEEVGFDQVAPEGADKDAGRVDGRAFNSGTRGEGTRSQESWPLDMKGHVRIQNMHEQIITWMIAHPECRTRDLAAAFGVSQVWVSHLTRSHAFRARLSARQDEVFGSITDDIKTKLTTIADVGIERLSDVVEKTQDPEFLLSAVDKTLKHLGYGAPRPPGPPLASNQQNNFFLLSREELDLAKQKMLPGVEVEKVVSTSE